MKKAIARFGLFVLICLASPQAYTQTRDKEIQVSLGVGAGLNPPARFDLDIAGEYFFNDTFSAGLDFDLFVRGGVAYNFLGFGRYHFELLDHPRFLPYIGGGLGVLVNSNGRGFFDLMAPELGFLFELTPHLYLGPNISFHILAGKNTTWDLQTVAQMAYRF